MTDPPESAPPVRESLPTLVDFDLFAGASRVDDPADRLVLVQTSGLEAGRVCPLALDEVTLGRASNCTFAFDDGSLGSVHARLVRDSDGFAVEDAGAPGGTFVNDQPVTRASLFDGDRVRIGTVTLRLSRVSAREEDAMVEVYEASTRDGLTGAYNRRHLLARLEADVAYARRHKDELSLIMVDVDDLRALNDLRGTQAGDAALAHVTRVLMASLSGDDLVARFGGEELVVVLRGVGLAAATELAERLRAAVEAAPLDGGGESVPVHVSAGVASLACCTDAPGVAALLTLAEGRMAAAKRAGKNRVVAA